MLIFSKSLQNTWDVFCEFKLWFTHCLSHCSDTCNIMSYWTALQRYATVTVNRCNETTHWKQGGGERNSLKLQQWLTIVGLCILTKQFAVQLWVVYICQRFYWSKLILAINQTKESNFNMKLSIRVIRQLLLTFVSLSKTSIQKNDIHFMHDISVYRRYVAWKLQTKASLCNNHELLAFADPGLTLF